MGCSTDVVLSVALRPFTIMPIIWPTRQLIRILIYPQSEEVANQHFRRVYQLVGWPRWPNWQRITNAAGSQRWACRCWRSLFGLAFKVEAEVAMIRMWWSAQGWLTILTASFISWGKEPLLMILKSANPYFKDHYLKELLSEYAGATALSNAVKFLSDLEELNVSIVEEDGQLYLRGVCLR